MENSVGVIFHHDQLSLIYIDASFSDSTFLRCHKLHKLIIFVWFLDNLFPFDLPLHTLLTLQQPVHGPASRHKLQCDHGIPEVLIALISDVEQLSISHTQFLALCHQLQHLVDWLLSGCIQVQNEERLVSLLQDLTHKQFLVERLQTVLGVWQGEDYQRGWQRGEH